MEVSLAAEFTSQIKLSAIPFSRLRYFGLIELDLPPFEVRIGVVFFRSRHSPDDGLPLLLRDGDLREVQERRPVIADLVQPDDVEANDREGQVSDRAGQVRVLPWGVSHPQENPQRPAWELLLPRSGRYLQFCHSAIGLVVFVD